jgi:hypothetical protein
VVPAIYFPKDVQVALIFVTVVTMSNTNRRRRNKTMTDILISWELQPPTKPRRLRSPETSWDRFITAINNPQFLVIVAFCALGLLISLIFMLRFPELGAVIEQYNQF